MTGRWSWARTGAWLAAAAALLIWVAPFAAHAAAQQFPPASGDAAAPTTSAYAEVHDALIRLPFAAALGTILAMRPKHRNQRRRNALVVQTQIMLAVVAAVIMIIVGSNIARAFGIAGAANLVRYRSTIDDPKEAVVMLCALTAGLAIGAGYYYLAPLGTVFMALMLWIVEYFEPTARKKFELKISMKNADAFRPKLEDLLAGFKIDYELLVESDEELGYSLSTPMDVRTRDISDTIRLICGVDDVSIEWDEKKDKK
jgi:uncharacterized membrane protein YhiD involved in acid resistance